MRNLLSRFWSWYNSHKTFNTGFTAGLFVLQLVHLYWLTTHVAFLRLFGESFWSPSAFWELVIILVDYTEIPAIILTSILYVNEFRAGRKARSLLYLFFINSQWLHMFWITDEVVVAQFTGAALVTLPVWLSWCAILIDYLELPVIYDTLKKFFISIIEGQKQKSADTH
ncbi:MAG: hypothetical protein Q7S86_04560 [bacterium]|nr:hypothetical protein [bacterium]